MEDKFEQEVEREDFDASGGSQVTSLRPSRRTIESVKSTERLMEVLDEAHEQREHTNKHPCLYVVQYVNTLNASNIYEVLLALPFSHAQRLLHFISEFLEAVSSLPEAVGQDPTTSTVDERVLG